VDDIQAGVYGRFVGDHLALGLEREGHSLTVDLVLSEVPASAE
jgi:hypothetical protein